MTINFTFSCIGSKTIGAYATDATFDGVPLDCKDWAERVAKAALDAVRSIPFERNATDRLTDEQFKEKYLVRRCEKCCATCKHGVDMCDDGCYWCKHPAVKNESLYTSESMVCAAWEA